jgi:hypothetical protein
MDAADIIAVTVVEPPRRDERRGQRGERQFKLELCCEVTSTRQPMCCSPV